MKDPDSLQWLSRDCMPRWLAHGLDTRIGGFVENLSLSGEPLGGSRRCMVQARQIYSYRAAMRLGAIPAEAGRAGIESGLKLLLEKFSLPSGAFRHSIGEKGDPLDETPGLYGQAFAIFGLAEAYGLLKDSSLRVRARAVADYLGRERRAPGGGYTELENGGVVYRSNPHMHLFEAALAWIEVDNDPFWRTFADELATLCLTRFIDKDSGALGENFVEGWGRERDEGGRFFWEPGHHCEWAWLLGRHQLFTGRDHAAVRGRLFEQSEKYGRDSVRGGALIDQVWNDGTAKLRSARFWPQCERIKAASQLGRNPEASEGLRALFRYFENITPGLWYDTWEANGTFREQPVKASSLYHIIGAISEFQKSVKS
jgi:mannose/cellobiose epimerase-like protein (N-acyl-D-glucosamine 2-epimerase family)